MIVLIVGVDGLIGGALGEAMRIAGHRVVGTSRRRDQIDGGTIYLDLADEACVDALLPAVDVAFFCAAIAEYRTCRENEPLARRVNAEHPAVIAKKLVESGSRVVLLSTSAVIDCRSPRMRADRPRQPASAYGRTKAEAELAFLALGTRAAVLRLTKILTRETGLFPGWIRDLGKGSPVECADDFRFSPITLEHVVRILTSIAGQQEGGVFQVSAATDISYAEAAWHMADRLNVPRQLVQGRSSEMLKIDADVVTAYTSLDSERIEKKFSFVPPNPRDVIDSVMGSLFAAARTATTIRAGT